MDAQTRDAERVEATTENNQSSDTRAEEYSMLAISVLMKNYMVLFTKDILITTNLNNNGNIWK